MKNHNASSQSMQFGDQFKVMSSQGDAVMMARLSEIGIRQGQTLVYFSKAPFGGPRIFRTGPTMFALREEELACLILQKI